MGRLPKLVYSIALLAAVGCGGAEASSSSIPSVPSSTPSTASLRTASGLSADYPTTWHAKLQADMVYRGQSILITSYPVGTSDSYVEARNDRPPGGVLMLIMDILPADEYLHDSMLVPGPDELTIGAPSAFEGLGEG